MILSGAYLTFERHVRFSVPNLSQPDKLRTSKKNMFQRYGVSFRGRTTLAITYLSVELLADLNSRGATIDTIYMTEAVVA